MGSARFSAQVTQCASNFHQNGLAVTNYAVANDGYLPSGKIHASFGPNPEHIARENMNALLDYGQAQPETWFCPTRGTEVHDKLKLSRIPTTPEEMLDELMLFGSNSVVFPQSWYVYRRVGIYEVPWEAAGNSADLWPSRIDDSQAIERPLMVDKLMGRSVNHGFTDPAYAWGGHRRGGPSNNGGVQSVNRLFADGKVVTIPARELNRNEVQSAWVNWW